MPDVITLKAMDGSTVQYVNEIIGSGGIASGTRVVGQTLSSGGVVLPGAFNGSAMSFTPPEAP